MQLPARGSRKDFHIHLPLSSPVICLFYWEIPEVGYWSLNGVGVNLNYNVINVILLAKETATFWYLGLRRILVPNAGTNLFNSRNTRF